MLPCEKYKLFLKSIDHNTNSDYNAIQCEFVLWSMHFQKEISEEWLIPRSTLNTIVKECIEKELIAE